MKKITNVYGAKATDTLFIGDLSIVCSEDDLLQQFSSHQIVSIEVQQECKVVSYGFVKFISDAEAGRAMQELNAKMVFGRKLRIGWASLEKRLEAKSVTLDLHFSFISKQIISLVYEQTIREAMLEVGCNTVEDIEFKSYMIQKNSKIHYGNGFIRLSPVLESVVVAKLLCTSMKKVIIEAVMFDFSEGNSLLALLQSRSDLKAMWDNVNHDSIQPINLDGSTGDCGHNHSNSNSNLNLHSSNNSSMHSIENESSDNNSSNYSIMNGGQKSSQNNSNNNSRNSSSNNILDSNSSNSKIGSGFKSQKGHSDAAVYRVPVETALTYAKLHKLDRFIGGKNSSKVTPSRKDRVRASLSSDTLRLGSFSSCSSVQTLVHGIDSKNSNASIDSSDQLHPVASFDELSSLNNTDHPYPSMIVNNSSGNSTDRLHHAVTNHHRNTMNSTDYLQPELARTPLGTKNMANLHPQKLAANGLVSSPPAPFAQQHLHSLPQQLHQMPSSDLIQWSSLQALSPPPFAVQNSGTISAGYNNNHGPVQQVLYPHNNNSNGNNSNINNNNNNNDNNCNSNSGFQHHPQALQAQQYSFGPQLQQTNQHHYNHNNMYPVLFNTMQNNSFGMNSPQLLLPPPQLPLYPQQYMLVQQTQSLQSQLTPLYSHPFPPQQQQQQQYTTLQSPSHSSGGGFAPSQSANYSHFPMEPLVDQIAKRRVMSGHHKPNSNNNHNNNNNNRK